LVEELPHRLGLVYGGDGLDHHPVLAQRRHGGAQMGGAIADI
jgi:hypothetical protein